MAPRARRVRPIRRVAREERLSIVAHLTELRNRIFVALAAFVVAFFAAYIFRDRVLNALTWPLPDRYERLSTFSPTEAFFATLKVCAWVGILAALPVWLYQLYAYVVPAVADQSRRRTLAVVAAVSSLFLVGVAFGYFVILPVALRFLLSFGGDNFNQNVRAGDYFTFATTMLLASGALFEVPVAMVALSRIGIVTAQRFRQGRRFAIVIMAVLAALLPGGDPFSMLLLILPQVVLYELGIRLSELFARRREVASTRDDASAVS